MVGAVLFAIWSIRPLNWAVPKHCFLIFTAELFYYPLFRAVTGGVNTPVSLLLIALRWRMAKENRDFLAKVFLGLLLFKPQYAVPLIGLFFLAKR